MNDDELITAVKESVTGVRMTIPADQIASRSRAIRARRRVPVLAGAGAVALTAALVVGLTGITGSGPAHNTGAGPARNPGTGGPARAQLAAWTVTRQADGSIQVTFFRHLRDLVALQAQLRDLVALQATLRADGVPASVTFTGRQNPACQPYPGSGGKAFWPFGPKTGPWGMSTFIRNPKDAYNTQDAMVIHPAALPSGAGLQIVVMRGIPPGPSGPWPYPKGSGHPVAEVFLVKSSPQCTGG